MEGCQAGLPGSFAACLCCWGMTLSVAAVGLLLICCILLISLRTSSGWQWWHWPPHWQWRCRRGNIDWKERGFKETRGLEPWLLQGQSCGDRSVAPTQISKGVWPSSSQNTDFIFVVGKAFISCLDSPSLSALWKPCPCYGFGSEMLAALRYGQIFIFVSAGHFNQ